jgi:hypothetical protein
MKINIVILLILLTGCGIGNSANIKVVNFLNNKVYLTKFQNSKFKKVNGKYALIFNLRRSFGYEYSIQNLKVKVFNKKGNYINSTICTTASYWRLGSEVDEYNSYTDEYNSYTNSVICSFKNLKNFLQSSGDITIEANYISSLRKADENASQTKKIFHISQTNIIETIKNIESKDYNELPNLRDY